MSFMSVQMARRGGASAPINDGLDRAVTTRPASTALLSVDSQDRAQFDASGNLVSTGNAGDFTINKRQALFNGFFNRIAMNELVLDWCVPNISATTFNNTISVTLSSVTVLTTIPTGFYNVSECLDEIVYQLNLPSPNGFGVGTFRVEDRTGASWSSGSIGLAYLATSAGTNFTINITKLAEQMGLQIGTAGAAFPVTCPNILGIRYLDFVSSQLTYNQDLKDNTTNPRTQDVLYRWVFAYDNGPIPLDVYNYPILQGYKEFITRRYLNYPKQILWDPTAPLGQLSFQVYDDGGDLLNPADYLGEMEYQMSLLFSEN
jgi:hypothetical protein